MISCIWSFLSRVTRQTIGMIQWYPIRLFFNLLLWSKLHNWSRETKYNLMNGKPKQFLLEPFSSVLLTSWYHTKSQIIKNIQNTLSSVITLTNDMIHHLKVLLCCYLNVGVIMLKSDQAIFSLKRVLKRKKMAVATH